MFIVGLRSGVSTKDGAGLDTQLPRRHGDPCGTSADSSLVCCLGGKSTTFLCGWGEGGTSLIPQWEIGWPYLGKDTAAARAALPIASSVCGISVCPNKGTAVNACDL